MSNEEWFEAMSIDNFVFEMILCRVHHSSVELLRTIYEKSLSHIEDTTNHNQVIEGVELAIRDFVKEWDKVDYVIRRLKFG